MLLNDIDIMDSEAMVEDDTIREMVSTLENDVNIMGFNPEKYYREMDDIINKNGHVKFQLFVLAIQWIHFWATATDVKHNNSKANFNAWYDGRNEVSVVFCKDVYKNEYYQEILNKYGSDIDYRMPDNEMDKAEMVFAKFMKTVNTRMHRTNVQTATSLMIYALTTECDKCVAVVKLKEWLNNNYGDRFYAMPMI